MFLLGPLFLAVVSVIWAKEDYFPIQLNNTWDNARNYCQVCYKDLTTITPGNADIIIQKVIALNLSSAYWIGLRQNLSGSIPWSQWSNGAPVIYQNWYPGRPVPKKPDVFVPTSPFPSTSTAGTTSSTGTTATTGTTSTSGTTSRPTDEQARCPQLARLIACINGSDYLVTPITQFNTSDFTTSKTSTLVTSTPLRTSSNTVRSTSSSTTTDLTTSASTSLITSTSYSTAKTDSDYIEDSCVALLSFGMWREKHCYENLPFICYDELFSGEVNVSSMTHGGGVVSWDKAPGVNVDHYRVELSNGNKSTTPNVTLELQNLVPGKRYKVQIFPVKCGRDLNPLDATFYTLPMTISNIMKVKVETNFITLNWSVPIGERDNYFVNWTEKDNKTFSTELCTITDLEPGQLYTFTVRAVVNKSLFGEPDTISVYTKPSMVQNLTSLNNDSTAINVSWSSSDRNTSSHCYKVLLNETVQENCTVSQNASLPNLTSGTTYRVTVFALANGTEEGQAVSIYAFTKPEQVKNLTLRSTENTTTATWILLADRSETLKFNVSLYLNNKKLNEDTVYTYYHTFTDLKSTSLYVVSVTTIVGILLSEPATATTYTLPDPPDGLKTSVINTTTIELSWYPPKTSAGGQNITYNLSYTSPFWGTSATWNTINNSTVISNLTPGTKYILGVAAYAGVNISRRIFINATTVANFKNLTLTMLCSSDKLLYCKEKVTKDLLQTKLNNTIITNFDDSIVWHLYWKEGK